MIRLNSLIPAGINRPNYRLAVGISLLVLTALLMPGCSDQNDNETGPRPQASSSAQANASPVKREGVSITANPNPVPAGPEPRGKTTITWSVKGFPAQDVHVYVSSLGGTENLFATGSDGSQEVPWISIEPVEFKLYVGTGPDKKLLDQVVVKRNQ